MFNVGRRTVNCQEQVSLTFAHISISRDGASLSCLLAGAAGRKANQTDAVLQIWKEKKRKTIN
jgi:hypothetical protein